MNDVSLQIALQGVPGALDAWLEVNSEGEIRAAILLLASPQETLRDKFAAKAMQGFCSNPDEHFSFATFDETAKLAYGQADAMLRAREVRR